MKYGKYTNVPSVFYSDPNDKYCYITGSHVNLDFHHIMNGPYKHKSEEDGFWVWLRHDVHMKLHSTPEGAEMQKTMKQKCQQYYERYHSREQWLKRYHKNYL